MSIDAKWALHHTPKHGRFGMPRIMPAAETDKNLKPLLEKFQIRSRRDILRVDRDGVPVYMVKRTEEYAGKDFYYKGKGYTDIDARVSALMEAVERFSAERYDGEIVCATYQEIKRKGPAVNPDDLGPRVEKQYTKNCIVEWVRGFDLIQQLPTFVPLNLIIYPYMRGPELFRAGSVGLASGNTMEESISHALCEVIEHDALGISSIYNPTAWKLSVTSPDGSPDAAWAASALQDTTPCLAFPLLDAATFPPRAARVAGKLKEAGLMFFPRNITTDIGIASVRCLVVETCDDGTYYSFDGGGTHPNAEIALLRALGEGALSHSAGTWLRKRNLCQPFSPLPIEPQQLFGYGSTSSFADMPSYKNKTVDEDIRLILKRLQDSGLGQAVAVDLTKPEINFPTVRIVIPGTEYLCEEPGKIRLGPRAKKELDQRCEQFAHLQGLSAPLEDAAPQ